MPLTVAETFTWQDFALCSEVGPETFFALDDDRERPSMYRDAKRVCSGCIVSELCLNAALTFEQGADRHNRAGVWGGMTPHERADLDENWAGESFNLRNDESTT